MNGDRLLKLAALLESLPPERFEYSSWVGAWWAGQPLHECSTTACALGWATTVPEFGLRLVLDGERGSVGYVTSVDDVSTPDSSAMYDRSERAGCAAFDIDRTQFSHLFVPRDCDGDYDCAGEHEYDGGEDGEDVSSCSIDETRATPAQVAAKIRRFVERGGAL